MSSVMADYIVSLKAVQHSCY